MCQDQIIENNVDDRVRKTVDNAVLTVKKREHDAILVAMDNIVLPPVEMPVRSITVSSGRGPSSMFQDPDQRDIKEILQTRRSCQPLAE